MYGVLRAGRSQGTEAIVLSAPLLPNGRNHHGIAVMLALAEYFQSKLLDCGNSYLTSSCGRMKFLSIM